MKKAAALACIFALIICAVAEVQNSNNAGSDSAKRKSASGLLALKKILQNQLAFNFTRALFQNFSLIAKMEQYLYLLHKLEATSDSPKLYLLSAVLEQVIVDTCDRLNEAGFAMNCSDRDEVILTAIAVSLLPSVNRAWDSITYIDNIDDCLWIASVFHGQQPLRNLAVQELNCPT